MTATIRFTIALALATSFASATRLDSRGQLQIPTAGFADLVDRTLPAVVRVAVTRPASPSNPRKTASEASGVLIAADGFLLTNHHVIEGASAVKIQLHDEREFPATLIASDPATDLAVLKIDATDLPTLPFGDSSRVRVGDLVLAIGNPYGIGVTVTSGIVSARGRGANGPEDYIQTDAAINPGNSGGPLLAADGSLIGINTAIISPSGSSAGVGLAIPSNVVRSVMTDLIVNGKVARGYLGIGLQPLTPALADALGLPDTDGVLIADVTPNSPAATAGLEKGAVILAINDRPVRSWERLRLFIAAAKPGATLNIRTTSPAGEKSFAVTLTERPESAPNLAPSSEEQLPQGAVVAPTALPGNRAGILMLAIDPNGHFAAAGLRPGDVISAVNRRPVSSVAELKQAISTTAPNSVLIEATREGAAFFFALSPAAN